MADFGREPEPRDPDEWVEEFACELPGWAVKAALKYYRGDPFKKGKRVHERLAVLARRKEVAA
jgi:hypothetical protein